MAGKKRKKSKVMPLHYGPSVLLIVTAVVLGILVLVVIANNTAAL